MLLKTEVDQLLCHEMRDAEHHHMETA